MGYLLWKCLGRDNGFNTTRYLTKKQKHKSQ